MAIRYTGIILGIWAMFAAAVVAETVYWPYFCYPPVFICQDAPGSGEITGTAAAVQELLWKHLPAYQHERIYTSLKRMLTDVRHGKHYCIVGLLKNAEREAYLHYSLPCRIDMPHLLFVRRADRKRFGGGLPVSLETVLADKSVRFGAGANVSLGRPMDQLLAKYRDQSGFYPMTGEDPDGQLLRMLLAGRLDCVMALPQKVKAMGIAEQVAGVPIKERLQEVAVGYVACPKTPWGRQMIDQINAVLQQEICKPAFFKSVARYYPSYLHPLLQSYFDRYICDPIRAQSRR